ncbi:hypothetical protein [Streptomyces sp. NPDC054783]
MTHRANRLRAAGDPRIDLGALVVDDGAGPVGAITAQLHVRRPAARRPHLGLPRDRPRPHGQRR